MTHARALRLTTLLAFLLAVLWGALLGGRALVDPDEGRYAEISREMLVSGDWVIPQFDGLPYLEKPPLQYWATAAIYGLLGVNEWTARCWTGLTSLLTIVLIWRFAARRWGCSAAAWAAGALASGTLFVFSGHLLTLDAGFTLFLTLALLQFAEAQLARGEPRDQLRHMLACWAALGLAVLSKGVAALVLPALTLAIYAFWQRDWPALRNLHWLRGSALLAAITLPWFVMAARNNHDFLEFFFVHEHLQRFLTDGAARVKPWWFFAAILAAGTLPWLPQSLVALWRGRQRSAARGEFDLRRLLWLWCVVVLVFFSASHSKLAPYILPMLPALALLLASSADPARPRLLWPCVGVTAVLALLLAALPGSVVSGALQNHDDLQALPSCAATLYVMAALLLGGAMLAVGLLRRQAGNRAAFVLGVAWLLAQGTLLKGLGAGAQYLSAKSLAHEMPVAADTRVPVFTLRQFRHTLPFYWQRPVTPVDYRGELDLGLRQQPHAGIAGMDEFTARWRREPQAVAVMPRETLAALVAQGLPLKVAAADPLVVVVLRR